MIRVPDTANTTALRPRLRGLFAAPLLAWLLAAGGCGAGVITGGLLSGGGGGGGGEVSSLTISVPEGPLTIDGDEVYGRSAVLRGSALRPELDLGLALRWASSEGVVEEVQTILLTQREGGATTLTFVLTTAAIAAAAGDVTSADISAELVARGRRADGSVATELSAPFLLRRRPTLELVPEDSVRGLTVVPVSGGQLELVVAGLPSADPSPLTVEVGTNDPDPPDPVGPAGPVLIRRASNLRTEALPDGRVRLLCTAPSSSFPIAAFVRVQHETIGRSTVVGGLVYRPELITTAARRGSTDGDDLVTLIGRGLVPFDFSSTPARLDFTRVEITFEKNGREQALPAGRLRPSLSSSSAIVFVTPPSPDGRPGPAKLRLKVSLPQEITVASDGLFAYAADSPGFQPRGVELPLSLAASALGPLRHTVRAGVPTDVAAAFFDGVGVPFVQVYEGRDNGMFTRLGPPILAADRSVSSQRHPTSLLFGDFHGDGHGDLLVLNRGEGLSVATLLAGRDDEAAPLVHAGAAFPRLVGPDAGVVARFDNDGRDDVVVFGVPDILRATGVARPDARGNFVVDDVFGLVPPPRLERIAAEDLDRDGHVDLFFGAASTDARLLFCYGPATAGFPQRLGLDLSSIGVLAGARVVGLHGGPVGPHGTEIAMVCADPGNGRGVFVSVRPTAARGYGVPQSFHLMTEGVPSRSMVADLDGDGSRELLVGFDDGSLRLYRFDLVGLVELVGALDVDPLDYGQVLELDHDQVGTDPSGRPVRAVFVTHQQPPSRSFRPRVTTFLVGSGPVLESPRSERVSDLPIRNVALGAVRPASPRGAAGAVTGHEGALDVWDNDGFGRLERRVRHPVQGLLPSTLTSIPSRPAGPRDRFVFLGIDGRIGWLDPDTAAPRFLPRPLFEGPGDAAEGSLIRAGDVDGDGRIDLVVLVTLQRSTGIEQHIALLRGASEPGGDPWVLPHPDAVVDDFPHEITDVALGAFAAEPGAAPLLVALAVPGGAVPGVHFFRHSPDPMPGHHWLVPAELLPDSARVAGGLGPSRILATDLEADGRDDLIVVSDTRGTIHVLRQSGAGAAEPGFVDAAVFGQTDERLIPQGAPVRILSSDVDGDLIDDVVVHTRQSGTSPVHEIAVFVLNGLDGFVDCGQMPCDTVISEGPTLAIDLGDTNGDGLTDLVLGRGGAGDGGDSHLRLLFGTYR